MKKIDFKKDLSSVMFSLLLFQLALLPIYETIDIVFYLVSVLMILCGVIGVANCVLSIVKDKRSFVLNLTSRSIFSYLEVVTAFLGLMISYSFHSNTFNFWIFILVCSLIFILMPNRPIKSDTMQKE